MNVDDLLENGAVPRNLTIDRVATVDDDPNWSPDGRRIIFTSYVPEPSSTITSSEIHIINADGTGHVQLTTDRVEKARSRVVSRWPPHSVCLPIGNANGKRSRCGDL
ncbi:MAG TPA: hypothetical protein VFU38_00735 [Candidatus Krumholzibacteria bacterium]|nr:hypothetical protein [Candidatus Krumholzibacteria bacterium]